MRGQEENQGFMFTYLSSEQRVPEDHPLRMIRAFADAVLKEMNPTFKVMYSNTGTTFYSSGTVVESAILDRFVYGARGPDVLRAIGLQHSVPLVPRYEF